MSLGHNLKRERALKGWSLRKLESLSGVSDSMISQIENNPDVNPSLATIRKLANALGVTSTELLNDESAETSNPDESDWHTAIAARIQALSSDIDDLAEKVDSTPEIIRSIPDENPDLALIQKLALTLDTTMHYLLGRTDDPAGLPGVTAAHHEPDSGYQPGDPIPPETQLIVERAIMNAKEEWGWTKKKE